MNKQILILLCALFAIGASVVAQSQDSISVEKRWGTVFTQNGKVLKPRQLLEITHKSPEAYQSMLQAKKNYDAGAVIGFIGGFMVGWPCGTALAGGDPEWAMAGIGAGLIAISIPFSTAYVKHTKRAVAIYNGTLINETKEVAQINFGATSAGIGVKVTF
ncbi:hypothetical protein KEM09_02445 [Carboxylicivirga mesophila]|uniref:DUF4199 domain-containing protein n=1 Tax=Carboxylicivirga mesophila TaxID=1166478 RepID=A0ABS5K6V5_9BACT|nr:hypothetical protein [Carboxylicivirga mesophila]MBS2210241.1 hypothetical protein [Carboxylicivirga mesophila]